MPHKIRLEKLPTGYAVASARPGEPVDVIYREFTSSEDGLRFIQRLEEFPTAILNGLEPHARILPSKVDHMLALIRRDKTADVYLNEIRIKAKMQVKRTIQSGEKVFKDDIADVDRLVFDKVTIPDDVGVLFLFSIGWRKGLFYDFGLFAPNAEQKRNYDIMRLLGSLYAYVLFQERFSITQDEWSLLFGTGWFPFATLSNSTIEDLLNHMRSGWQIDKLEEKIVEEVRQKVSVLLAGWKVNRLFTDHLPILEKAVDRFLNGDFISCISLLYPRIEGLMRSNFLNSKTSGRMDADHLSKCAVVSRSDNASSLLLPYMFYKYLKDVYFAGFNPEDRSPQVSRHTVSHGVASPSEFSGKSAAIALLIVNQLHLFFGLTTPGEKSEGQTAT